MELIHEQTNTGIFKSEWKVECLGKAAEVTTGKKDVNEGNPEGEYPFFTCSRKHTFSDSYSFDAESILIAGNGEVGNLHYFKGKFEAYQRTYVVRNFKCDAIYIWHQLNYRLAESLGLGKIGSSIPYIKKENLTGFEFPLPHDRSEQRAIAAALSDIDALIAGLERLIAKKRDIKQATMQQLLTGQIRLPGFSGEWHAKTLFDLAERKKELFDDGDWIEAQHIRSEGIRLIQTGNIGVGRFIEKLDKKFIDEKSFALLKCKELKTGDLLICRLADPAGRACVLPFIGEARVVTSVDVTIFRPPVDLINRAFLSQVFSMPDWFKKVSDRSGGTTHKRIARGALGRIEISVPGYAEQTAIASVLSEMDIDLSVLETRLAKTRAIKQGIMQELLTGKTRLI